MIRSTPRRLRAVAAAAATAVLGSSLLVSGPIVAAAAGAATAHPAKHGHHHHPRHQRKKRHRLRTQAAPVTAHVWMTTRDGARIVAPVAAAALDAKPLATDIAVDPSRQAQRFSGAGASITESSASVIDTLAPAQRQQLIEQLFGDSGLRLSYLRQPLGASDFVAHTPFFTYEDTEGTYDYSRDADTLPLVRAALAANPQLRIMGTPWSAPAWMKTNDALAGGTLRSDMVDAYADYLVRVARDAAASGVPLADLTVQNEPGLAAAYPSMTLSVAQQAAVLRAVAQRLTSAGLATHLWVYDHNWDGVATALQVLQQVKDLPRVQGAAFHCYAGDPASVAAVVRAGWRVYDDECSGTDSATPAATFADTLSWQTQHLVISALRAGAETVMTWNLALDAHGGPQAGACGTRCNGVVQIENGVVTKDAQYAVLGQVSEFVHPGAHVIASSTQGPGGVEDVAFLNQDGSRVVVVLNDAGSSRSFSISEGGRSLDYTLPAGAVASFVYAGG